MMASLGPALRNILAIRRARARVARTTRPTMMMTEFGISFLCPRRTGGRVKCLPQEVSDGGGAPRQVRPPERERNFSASWETVEVVPAADVGYAAFVADDDDLRATF